MDEERDSRTDENENKEDKPGKHALVFSSTPAPPTDDMDLGIPGGSPIFAKRKGKWFRSIRFNFWMTFVLMVALMLAVLWAYELFFYSTFYTASQQADLLGLGDEFASDYIYYFGNEKDRLEEYVTSYALRNGVDIVVFTVDRTGDEPVPGEIKFSAASASGTRPTAPEGAMWEFYSGMVDRPGEYNRGVAANTADSGTIQADLVVYGFRTVLDQEETCIYMTSVLASLGSSQNMITGQLGIISGVFLALGIVIAYFASGIASRPVRDLAEEVAVGSSGGGKREPLDTDTALSEINELSAAFNKAFDDVESNNRFRRDLLANVSHDMKTPLTMIRAYGEMIRDISGGNKEKSAKQAQIIVDETDRLTALINEVIELSKLESGVLELNVGVFDVSEKLAETVHRFCIMEVTKGYNFQTDIEPDLLVRADSDRIDRVVYNLVGNAMNYTGEDKTVLVRCHRIGDVAKVEVLDSGKGMTVEELTTVWDKYYRLAQDKRRVLGSGLGLSIVKSILELHNVTYGVESEKGHGSNFWFTLPLVTDSEELE